MMTEPSQLVLAAVAALVARLQLLGEATGGNAGLALVFPGWQARPIENTQFIVSSDPDPGQTLCELMEKGGVPAAFLFGEFREQHHLDVMLEPLFWAENWPGLENYLNTIVAYFTGLLAADKRAKPPAAN
jgi:hypothetical protein